MIHHLHRRTSSGFFLRSLAFAAVLSVCGGATLHAEEPNATRPDVKAAIAKARQYLIARYPKSDKKYRELVVYALLKSGGDESDPIIKEMIDEIIEQVGGEEYKGNPFGDRMYAVGLHAMILADAGADKYKAELEVIRDYIIKQQNDDGSWAYTKNSGSDLSVTQYAVLGLWAAQRAGADVPEEIWGKIALFHGKAQQDNGGFPYRAFTNQRSEMSMTAAGMSSLAIAKMHLPSSKDRSALGGGSGSSRPKAAIGAASTGADAEPEISADPTVRYGILYPVDEAAEREAERLRKEQEADEARRAAAAEEARQNAEDKKKEEKDDRPPPSVLAGVTAAPINRAAGYINNTFAVVNDKKDHAAYWYYTLERAASLTNRQSFGGKNWYDTCADFLLPKQASDGHWQLPASFYPMEGDTSFVLLFLSRPTAKFAKFKPPASRMAGGLLAGGRGLPTDLGEFGKPESKKPKTGLEKLLADLSEAETTELPNLQERLVEEIQVADREELVGQTDTLVKLVDHEDPEVRRTVLWAIGRTGDLRLARYPLQALDDANLGVLTEARNALAWIARTPDAKGFPENPLEGVPPGSPSDVRVRAVQKWQDGMWETWGRWYLERSPYEDRFDEFELDLRARLGRR